MVLLTNELWFPHAKNAHHDGLLAVGGDLRIERLMLAYRSGIFPWYEINQPIMWWSPDPRFVLFPEKFKVSKSLGKTLRSNRFEITFNQNFAEVITHCANVKRKGQHGTWITPAMQRAYLALHHAGHALSIEIKLEGKLVGGLYGVNLPEKRIFCGESMFGLVSDASKVAFFHLAQYTKTHGYHFIDCQLPNKHLQSLGAETMDRKVFLGQLGI